MSGIVPKLLGYFSAKERSAKSVYMLTWKQLAITLCLNKKTAYFAFVLLSLSPLQGFKIPVYITDISQYRLRLGFSLQYTDSVPFELLDSAALL
jgi:hypothetical protein